MWVSLQFLCEMINDIYIFDSDLKKKYARYHEDLSEVKLHKIWIDVTRKCNLACKHCFTDSAPERSESLTTEEIETVMADAVALGARRVAFGGGEPMIRPDIYRLVQRARELGMYPSLSTNGWLLNRDTLQRLKDAGLFFIQISIDSHLPEVHDQVRGLPGLLARCAAAIEICHELGIGVVVATTVMGVNVAHLADTMAWVKGMGVPVHRLIRYVDVGRGRDDNELDLHPEDLRSAMWEVIRRFGQYRHGQPGVVFGLPLSESGEPTMFWEHPNGCEAGKSVVDVLPEGNVVPCNYLGPDAPFNAGNIRQRSLRDIWTSSPVLEEWRAMDGRHINGCSGCPAYSFCGRGCRAAAFLQTASIYERDPYCPRV